MPEIHFYELTAKNPKDAKAAEAAHFGLKYLETQSFSEHPPRLWHHFLFLNLQKFAIWQHTPPAIILRENDFSHN